jgi:putative flippase GtrA
VRRSSPWVKFNGVGVLGFVAQIASAAALAGLGVPHTIATPIAVGVALIHNFTWHRKWTFPTEYPTSFAMAAAFLRFAGANGVVSLAGNTIVVPLLVDAAGWPLVPAMAAATGVYAVANYGLARRVVFGPARLPDVSPLN